MFIINENDELVEVDDQEYQPLCPDCGHNVFTFSTKGKPLVGPDLPTCDTCHLPHPKSYCTVCGIRPCEVKETTCKHCQEQAVRMFRMGYTAPRIAANRTGLIEAFRDIGVKSGLFGPTPNGAKS